METVTPCQFLLALWGEAPPADICIWRIPSKRSTWHPTPDRALEALLRKERRFNLYTGVSLPRPGTPEEPANRVSNQQAGWLGGLWADLDRRTPGLHDRLDLPETPAETMALLDSLAPTPTLVFETGNGHQAWWLFDGPTAIDAMVATLPQRHHQWLSAACAKLGWRPDPVHDVARVMRLPGTTNWKEPTQPKLVCTVRLDWSQRYSAAWWHDFLPELAARTPTTAAGIQGALGNASRPLPGPPPGPPDARTVRQLTPKLTEILNRSPRFQATWQEERNDLADNSASGYSLALASMADLAGWSPTEIIAMVQTWRWQRGKREKRSGWYTLLLERASHHEKSNRPEKTVK